jgi:hypothetical protein
MPKGKILMGKRPKLGPVKPAPRGKTKSTTTKLKAKQASSKRTFDKDGRSLTGGRSIYRGTDNSTSRDAARPLSEYEKRFDGRTVSAETPTSFGQVNKYVKYGSGALKEGNTIYSNAQKWSDPKVSGYGGPSQNTMKETTIGKGGRRESTLTRKSTSYDERYPTGYTRKDGTPDMEIYSVERGRRVVSEVQHNRGSGTRKTGAKKKAY